MRLDTRAILLTILATTGLTLPAFALRLDQSTPPSYPAAELDRIVSPIALYPDPLLAQLLAAATYPDQISDAATWADDHHYLSGSDLTAAMDSDDLTWDPSVQALLPFPSVLEKMASDPAWTQELGDAFLAQETDVLDAVQRMRQKARELGYLRSNTEVVVSSGPYVEIVPVNPSFIVVPSYDPVVVFAPPRPGFVIASAIRFSFGITIGAIFKPWGWGTSRFGWGTHTVIINNSPWHRTWRNRITYVHPYKVPHYKEHHVVKAPHPVERHTVIVRTPHEKDDAKAGRNRKEEHHPKDDHKKKDDHHH